MLIFLVGAQKALHALAMIPQMARSVFCDTGVDFRTYAYSVVQALVCFLAAKCYFGVGHFVSAASFLGVLFLVVMGGGGKVRWVGASSASSSSGVGSSKEGVEGFDDELEQMVQKGGDRYGRWGMIGAAAGTGGAGASAGRGGGSVAPSPASTGFAVYGCAGGAPAAAPAPAPAAEKSYPTGDRNFMLNPLEEELGEVTSLMAGGGQNDVNSDDGFLDLL